VTAPQALRFIIPPAGALFVSMLKDSSLVSLMGLWELNFLAQSYARSTFHYMEMLLAAAFIYWGMSIVFEIVQMRLEARFGRGFEVGGLPGAPRGRP
jgi:polar amino acid transport system permease protein